MEGGRDVDNLIVIRTETRVHISPRHPIRRREISAVAHQFTFVPRHRCTPENISSLLVAQRLPADFIVRFVLVPILRRKL
jgi:hypothetical protein